MDMSIKLLASIDCPQLAGNGAWQQWPSAIAAHRASSSFRCVRAGVSSAFTCRYRWAVTDLSLVRTSEHMAMGMAWWWVGGCACAEQTLHLQSSSSSLHGLASCCWWRECPLDCRGRASMQHDRTGPSLLSLSHLSDSLVSLVLSSSARCCWSNV